MEALLYTSLVLVTLLGVNGKDPLCSDNLLATLPDDHLSASSSKTTPTESTSPARARLNTTETTAANSTVLMGGWSPSSDSTSEYLQANFDDLVMINNIMTQGRNQVGGHVTSYKMEYTQDGVSWQTVDNDMGVEQIFMGNNDADSIQDGELTCPIFAKGIRIIPLSWDKNIGLRLEMNGCYLDNTPNTFTMPTVSTANASTAPPFLPGILTPFGPTTQAPQTNTPNLSLSQQPTTPTTPAAATAAVTTSTTTTTPTPATTTTPYVFLPGIQNPFGTGVPPSLIGK